MNWITVQDTIEPTHPFAPYAVTIASELLYKLTGEKFQGVQSATEYYTKDSFGAIMQSPALIGGQMYNLPSRAGFSGQSASIGDRKLYLRHTPIRSVDSIFIGSSLLDSSQYSIRNRAYLVRKGNARWMFDGINEVEVSYTYGATPPEAGRAAAVRFANELILAEKGDARCSLPLRVSSITRQNVSMTVLDPQEFLDNGKTGIYSVDLFIKAYNPDGARKKTKLFVAGRPQGERIN